METSNAHLFVSSHMFNAPREVVWRTWTGEEHIQNWLTPRGFSFTPMKMDFHPDGEFLYRLSTPNGHEIWGKWTFLEIASPVRLVSLITFTDKNGEIIRHPMNDSWPLEIHSVAEFRTQGDKTLMTIEWSPQSTQEDEIETFESSRVSMTLNWRGLFDRLDNYLEELAST